MDVQDRPRTITLDEQADRYGITRRAHPTNLVLETPRRAAATAAPINAAVVHTIDTTPSATQHVELRTNAIDRALGFMIATSPLAAGFGVVVLGVVVLGFGVPILSLPALVILFSVFAVVWTVAYLYTLSISAEGVSMYEAQSKWDIIRTEQAMRWQAWMLDRRGE